MFDPRMSMMAVSYTELLQNSLEFRRTWRETTFEDEPTVGVELPTILPELLIASALLCAPPSDPRSVTDMRSAGSIGRGGAGSAGAGAGGPRGAGGGPGGDDCRLAGGGDPATGGGRPGAGGRRAAGPVRVRAAGTVAVGKRAGLGLTCPHVRQVCPT